MSEPTVTPNEPVADFNLNTADGVITLSAYKGKMLILYFYPRDNTPGCTQESIDFRDTRDQFAKLGAEIVGVSRDSVRSHDNFRKKFALPFPLVSDENEALCTYFGVMKTKKNYGRLVRGIERSTFLIDKAGVLVREWRGVKVPGHVDAVLSAVRAMSREAN